MVFELFGVIQCNCGKVAIPLLEVEVKEINKEV
jgi:hypothetical protein